MPLPLRVTPSAATRRSLRPEATTAPTECAVLPFARPRVADAAPIPVVPPVGLRSSAELAERRRVIDADTFGTTLERLNVALAQPSRVRG